MLSLKKLDVKNTALDKPQSKKPTKPSITRRRGSGIGTVMTDSKNCLRKSSPSHVCKPKQCRRSKSVVIKDDLPSIERRIEFFRKHIFTTGLKKYSNETQKKLKKYFEELTEKRMALVEHADSQNPETNLADLHELIQQEKKPKGFGPWDTLWEHKHEDIVKKSPYSHFPSYQIRNIIIKGGDDLRQEIIAMQLIKKFRDIFVTEGTSLFVHPYEIIVTGHDSGVLEFVTDSISIDGLKKKYKGLTLSQIFKELFADGYIEAQKNFTESLAAYSLITYVLQIKDRHNGNILIDSKGHIVHIDFGFILTTSPGGINFESAPFKLTQVNIFFPLIKKDYVDLMSGAEADLWPYFKILLLQGYTAIKKYVDEICDILKIFQMESLLSCFEKFDMKTFRDRFIQSHTDQKVTPFPKTINRGNSMSIRSFPRANAPSARFGMTSSKR